MLRSVPQDLFDEAWALVLACGPEPTREAHHHVRPSSPLPIILTPLQELLYLAQHATDPVAAVHAAAKASR